MLADKSYMNIVAHYEKCLERHGDCHLGVDWQNPLEACHRYRVMLELIRQHDVEESVSLLDFGCGTAALYAYIQDRNLPHIRYTGLDISPAFTEVSRRKYPEARFLTRDILEPDTHLDYYDYIVMNGVFTEKTNLSFDQMFAYFRAMVEKVFSICNEGIALNVRSSHVDQQEDDLFHLPLDSLARFLTDKISRNFIIRNDYGLDEYTAYIYRSPDV